MEENIQNINDMLMKFGQRAMEDYANENIEGLTGTRTNNFLSMLSGYSAMLQTRMGELEVERAKFLVIKRNSFKSKTDTEDAWNGSELGLERIKLKWLLEAVTTVISACKNRLKQLQQESYNQQ